MEMVVLTLIRLFLFSIFLFCYNSFADTPLSNDLKTSIAFYYGDIDSVRELINYQRVVVAPEQLNQRQISQLKSAHTEVYAYLSIGEFDGIPEKNLANAIIGSNHVWHSTIMDARNEAWRNHLISKANQYHKQGYKGIFLDTLDSYQLVLANEEYESQQVALASLIDTLAINHSILLNRGFELLKNLSQPPKAVVAESLFYSYNHAKKSYQVQTPNDSAWLINQLNLVKKQGIEAIVIDYLADKEERIVAAKKILTKGFTPYVTDGLLNQFGVSIHYPVPRRVLGFYDSQIHLKKQSECHKFLATLVEYQGYVPQCIDIHSSTISDIDFNRYAAAMFWLPQASYQHKQLPTLLKQSLQKIPTVIIGELPSDSNLLSELGFKAFGHFEGKLSTIDRKLLYPLPNAAPEQFPRYQSINNQSKTLVEIIDDNGNKGVGVAKTPWGGVFLEPLTVQELIDDRSRWALEPFENLIPLLQLPDIPVPDVTTESGLRIVTAHIDGDGFPSVAWLPERPYAGTSILEKILKKTPLPHTVSIVEAELAPHGLYPTISAELEKIAREIFALNNVEIASHTFSHPFFWDNRVDPKEKLYGDSLPVPNYTLDYDREIFGSVNYINKVLAPKEKQVKVFLWSGMADPTVDVISKLDQLGLYNVNGGNTYVLKDNFSISQVYPHLNWYKEGVQVYAATMNENLYTELWTENFSGFARATETFELLGAPRRLKPVSIYYHMYSGVYPASINALVQLYNWVSQHELTPLYLSEYAERARNLYETGIAKSIENELWYINSTGVRSVRINEKMQPGALSNGVIGSTLGPDGNYLSLNQARSSVMLVNKKTKPFDGKPYLAKANAVIESWQQNEQQIALSVLSHSKLKLSLAQATQCHLKNTSSASLSSLKTLDTLTITSSQSGRHMLIIQCQQMEQK